jgi:hypothetical protein
LSKNRNEEEHLKLGYSLAVQRVAKDLRDEWFPDPILYKDVLNANLLQCYFEKNPDALFGSRAEQFNLPKSGFTIRCSLYTSIHDRIICQAIVDDLIEICDPQFSECVYGQRLKTGKNVFMFEHGVEAWKNFVMDISAEIFGSNNVLLVADIQSYFEFISFSTLSRSLDDMGASGGRLGRNGVKVLLSLLRQWSPHSSLGIPQNTDPSSFLGNVYLHAVDQKMISMGYNYFRYMDDIRIICKDKYHARRALRDLSVELRRRKLSLNAEKTKILYQDDSEYTKFMPRPDRVMEEIDALMRTRKSRDAWIALPKLLKFNKHLIKNKLVGQREFRFCLNRLEKFARCEVFNIDLSDIIDPCIDLLCDQPWTTDSIVRLLKCLEPDNRQMTQIEDMLTDDRKCIYEWQAYLLWQLVTLYAKTRGLSRRLLDLAKQKLDTRCELPMKAGAILYIGACGKDVDKQRVAKYFQKVTRSHLVTRSSLIATHEVPDDIAESYIKPFVPKEYAASYDYLRSSDYSGDYCIPLPKLPPKELYNDLPAVHSP